METNDLMARIEKLEAESYVLRAYVAMLVKMLPGTQPVGLVIADTTRTINNPRHGDGLPSIEMIQATTKGMSLATLARNGIPASR